MARRHAWSVEAATGVVAAIASLIVVAGIEIVEGSSVSVSGWLAIGPFIAAAFAPWRAVVGVGALATLIATGAALWARDGFDQVDVAVIIGMTLTTAAAVAVSKIRQTQAQRYADLVKLATVAQQAVVRPLGPQVGQL